MSEQAIFYSTLLTVAAIINAILAAFVWRRRQSPAAVSLFLLGVGLAWWAGTYAVYWSNIYSPTPYFWLDITYLGVVVTITSFFTFSLQYTNRGHWLKRPLMALLVIEPIIILLLLWTDPLHGLFFGGKRLPGSSNILDGGIVFWAHILYSYLLLVIAFLLLLQNYQRTPAVFRKQIRLILLSALVPWIGTTIGLLGLNPLPELDLTPIAFTITGVLLVYAFYRHNLLDIVPVARHTLVDTMPDGVVVLDGKDRIIDVNPAARQLLDLDKGAVEATVGYTPRGAMWQKVAKLGLEEQAERVQTEIEIGSGENGRFLEIHVSPLRTADGRYEGRLFTLRDITRAKQLETALRQKNEELEAYAHIVAHDLKSPLSVIYGFSEILQQESFSNGDPERAKMLNTIQRNSQKMAAIIDELLLLAHIEQGDIAIQAIQMGDIVEQSLFRNNHLIDSKAASITLPESWPIALGYAPWIEEVWTNYLSNGLKYGGDPPQLVLGADSQPDGLLRFWVRDNGPGIPESLQPRLFKKFSRLDGETELGHGLGLSIARRIITRLGGTVGVESKAGVGCTFYFTLPPAPTPEIELP
jgi:PAS domain S-box-containing protein